MTSFEEKLEECKELANKAKSIGLKHIIAVAKSGEEATKFINSKKNIEIYGEMEIKYVKDPKVLHLINQLGMFI